MQAILTVLPDGAGVVLQLEKRCYYPLTKSGVLLWHLYDNGAAVADDGLVAALVARYRVDDATARRDVTAFVERLVAEKILLPA